MKILIEIPKALAVLETVKEIVPTFVQNYNHFGLKEPLKDLEHQSKEVINKCNLATAILNSKATININKGPFVIELQEEYVVVSVSNESFNKGLEISKETITTTSSILIQSLKQTHILYSRIKNIIKE